ncbi:MAG: hypothetical protein KAU95_01125, partial [Candidatus Aenigmarchaeota archaeon]|nr:hypothetical protein [Candidatus Aenigmarchaeota archaeon]
MVKRIALDIEGTIADIHKPFIENYNKVNGTKFNLEHIKNWNFKDSEFKPSLEEFFEFVKNMWYEEIEKIQSTEGKLGEKLLRLHNLHNLDIVTSSIIVDGNEGNKGRDILLGWLEKNKIPFNKFVHLNLKKSKADLEY